MSKFDYENGYAEGKRAGREEERREVVEKIRSSKDYKLMVRLVASGYRNMSYDSDYELLLKELSKKE